MYVPSVLSVKRNEIGLYRREGELKVVFEKGTHVFNSWGRDFSIEYFSLEEPMIQSKYIEDYFNASSLDSHCLKIEIKEDERGLLWIDNKFQRILTEGKYVFLNKLKEVKVEVVSTVNSIFEHEQLRKIRLNSNAASLLEYHEVTKDSITIWYNDGKFQRILEEGKYAFWKNSEENVLNKVNMRQSVFHVKDHDLMNNLIFEDTFLEKDIMRLKVEDGERVLVWVNGCFNTILGQGKYLLFTRYNNIKVERIEITQSMFIHPAINDIKKMLYVNTYLDFHEITEGKVGIWYHEGTFQEELVPGSYVFWKDSGKNIIHHVDKREKVLDIQGQDILTADRVTVRLNVAVALQVVDARKQVEMVEDAQQMIYREIQLALREMVGQQKLDEMLVSKETLAADIFAKVVDRCTHFGVQINRVGVRDVILPGEMKELMNRVVEAQKSAEANLISRREETAAMRSQMNTARMIENNPTLMRLKEMEVLERIAEKSQLQILVGEKSMTEQVMKLV